MSSFYFPVGPRTSGLKSSYTKQRMKDHESYMTGFGGGKVGHKFNQTPSGEQYVVRQTSWMDMRIDSGFGDWGKKMSGRMWKRAKFVGMPALVGFAMIQGFWELTVMEAHRYNKLRYY